MKYQVFIFLVLTATACNTDTSSSFKTDLETYEINQNEFMFLDSELEAIRKQSIQENGNFHKPSIHNIVYNSIRVIKDELKQGVEIIRNKEYTQIEKAKLLGKEKTQSVLVNEQQLKALEKVLNQFEYQMDAKLVNKDLIKTLGDKTPIKAINDLDKLVNETLSIYIKTIQG